MSSAVGRAAATTSTGVVTAAAGDDNHLISEVDNPSMMVQPSFSISAHTEVVHKAAMSAPA